MKFVSDKPKSSGGRNSVRRENAKPAKQAKTKKARQSRQKSGGGGSKKGLVVLGAVAAVLVVGFFVMGVYANGIDTIYPKVTMEGSDIGGMEPERAAAVLSGSEAFKGEDKTLEVELMAGIDMKVSAREAGCWLNAEAAADYAMEKCHGNGFFGNTITYFRCLFGGMELSGADASRLDEDYLRRVVSESARQVQLALMDTDVDIGEDSITVVKGASAAKIDPEDLYSVVKSAMEKGEFDRIRYDAVTSSSEQVESLNVDQLYDTIVQEPVSAVYDPATKAATESQVGRSFDKAEAQRLWDAAAIGDKVVIPLVITEPAVTTEQLNSMLFSEVLSQKSTTLSGSSAARINNITKAAAAINGIIMNPGDEFSYNGTLGQRTPSAGYMAAGAYSGGKVVNEVGGGICQVSSTLYYCTLIANLEIVDRSCHYFGVNYLPAGLDATVSWPSPDFKFKNDSDYPIKIEAYVDSSTNSVVVRIYGCNPEGIRVEMTTETWTTADGYGAVSYRWVYDKNGNLISKKEEARSQYHYHTDDENEDPSPSPSGGESTDNPSPPPTDTQAPPPPTDPVTPPVVTDTPPTPPPVVPDPNLPEWPIE